MLPCEELDYLPAFYKSNPLIIHNMSNNSLSEDYLEAANAMYASKWKAQRFSNEHVFTIRAKYKPQPSPAVTSSDPLPLQ